MDGLTMRDRVGRLRVQRPSALPLGDPALRLRVERHLDAQVLHPARLPNGAVLIVRRLAMRVDLSSGRTDSGMQRLLDDLLAHAARPARMVPPPSAPAVFFADVGELLACLTRDVLQGRSHERWYWQQIATMARGSAASMLARTWQEHAHAAPAALRALAPPERRHLAAVLGVAGCSTLTRAIAVAFAVEPWIAARPVRTAKERSDLLEHPIAAGESAYRADAPWQPWLGAADTGGLEPAQVFLLGFGLVLAHAPAFARSAAFRQAAARWLDAVNSAGAPAPSPPGHAGTAAAAWPSLSVPSLAGSGAPASHQPATVPGAAFAGAAGAPPPSTAQGAQGTPATAGAPALRRTRPGQGAEPRTAAARAAEGVETGMAGVFYLVNLMRWLDLPAAAHDGGLDTHLGAWAMLDALARLLLPADSTAWAADPLWACLAELDGRPAAAVAGGVLRRPPAFHLHASWLPRWLSADRPWIAATVGDRLRLVDPAHGVLVADVPLAGRSPAGAAADELERYRAAGFAARVVPGALPRLPYLPASVHEVLAPGPGWWMRRANGFIRYVLARRLRCAPNDLAAVLAGLCRRRGRVTISHTHVDLYLSMEQIDMAARRSGLDQDPGWLPDFGRIVTFHFA